jgi:hypothetical protein
LLLSIVIPFLILEGIFRLLPVSYPPYILSVSAEHPVAHFQPNVEYLYSAGWNFAIRARKRSNNYGYNNLSDYRPDEATPLLVVVGDSFVEASQVDAGKSAAERLNAAVAGKGRVYAVGMSGAALSQYLVFAEFSRTTFHPDAMAFIIIGNDFDESLLKYMAEPRLHYFDADGTLRRVDYTISGMNKVLRRSAFVRYVMLNMTVKRRLGEIRRALREQSRAYAGEALEQRIVDSQRAVGYFFDQLPAKSGLGSESIVFVLDAVRPAIYPEAALQGYDSYHSRMRRYFEEQARSRGYEVLDMQPVFMRRHQLDNSTFEFPNDGHWNELGHRLVAEEIQNSAAFKRIFGPFSMLNGKTPARQSPRVGF